MRRFRNRLAILTPALALAAGGAASAGASSETPRALALSVVEEGDRDRPVDSGGDGERSRGQLADPHFTDHLEILDLIWVDVYRVG